MNALSKLSQIQSHEKWKIENHGIVTAQRKRGSIRNLLDFNGVVQLACKNLNNMTKEQASPYVNNLSTKYLHIIQAIDKQRLITRLFIQVILWICRFDKNFQSLEKCYRALPTKPKTEQIFPKKGGFSNGGNTCYMAT